MLCLNRAILAHFYEITHWELPPGYLCPPVPGRADYIHHLADLAGGKTPARVLDIGTGANCIYPIIGSRSYGWEFVGTDSDARAVASAQKIVAENTGLGQHVRIVPQGDPRYFFKGIIRRDEYFDFTMCNPPFYRSLEEAQKANLRKVKNLGTAGGETPRNFGGHSSELWCAGGELKFLCRMIEESAKFANQVGWFTSLVSKADHLRALEQKLRQAGVSAGEIIEMEQGQKRSRFIAWSFR